MAAGLAALRPSYVPEARPRHRPWVGPAVRPGWPRERGRLRSGLPVRAATRGAPQTLPVDSTGGQGSGADGRGRLWSAAMAHLWRTVGVDSGRASRPARCSAPRGTARAATCSAASRRPTSMRVKKTPAPDGAASATAPPRPSNVLTRRVKRSHTASATSPTAAAAARRRSGLEAPSLAGSVRHADPRPLTSRVPLVWIVGPTRVAGDRDVRGHRATVSETTPMVLAEGHVRTMALDRSALLAVLDRGGGGRSSGNRRCPWWRSSAPPRRGPSS